ncbi:hypothetical protein M432DRAFT_642329 [Thermoascus aurantiacus ATCC 26904]
MSWGRAAERLGSVGGGVARIAGARLAPTPTTGGMRGESPLVGSRDGGAGTAVSSSAGAGAALGPWERDVRRPTRAPLCASDAPALLRRFWKWMGYDATASLPCLFTANSSSNPAPNTVRKSAGKSLGELSPFLQVARAGTREDDGPVSSSNVIAQWTVWPPCPGRFRGGRRHPPRRHSPQDKLS